MEFQLLPAGRQVLRQVLVGCLSSIVARHFGSWQLSLFIRTVAHKRLQLEPAAVPAATVTITNCFTSLKVVENCFFRGSSFLALDLQDFVLRFSSCFLCDFLCFFLLFFSAFFLFFSIFVLFFAHFFFWLFYVLFWLWLTAYGKHFSTF